MAYMLDKREIDFRDVFTDIVQGKRRRIGNECPPGMLVTNYCVKGSPDPRTVARDWV